MCCRDERCEIAGCLRQACYEDDDLEVCPEHFRARDDREYRVWCAWQRFQQEATASAPG
jgi:hypothetical protein